VHSAPESQHVPWHESELGAHVPAQLPMQLPVHQPPQFASPLVPSDKMQLP
jgi:hypothetical protein